MRLTEFVEAVESYGVRVSASFAVGGRNHDLDLDVLGVSTGPRGQPGHRGYTPSQIRRVVSWLQLGQLLVSPKDNTALRLRATRLLAAAPEGYVVMADGRVWWSLVEPVATLRSTCAVVVPVPRWHH